MGVGAQPAELPRPLHESLAIATPRSPGLATLSFHVLSSLGLFGLPLQACTDGGRAPSTRLSQAFSDLCSHRQRVAKPSCSLWHLPWPPVRGPERALKQARDVTRKISAAASCPKKGHGRKLCSCSSRERSSANKVQQRAAGCCVQSLSHSLLSCFTRTCAYTVLPTIDSRVGKSLVSDV